jgi:hypothetical protein
LPSRCRTSWRINGSAIWHDAVVGRHLANGDSRGGCASRGRLYPGDRDSRDSTFARVLAEDAHDGAQIASPSARSTTSRTPSTHHLRERSGRSLFERYLGPEVFRGMRSTARPRQRRRQASPSSIRWSRRAARPARAPRASSNSRAFDRLGDAARRSGDRYAHAQAAVRSARGATRAWQIRLPATARAGGGVVRAGR